jgi:hypothetical protein
MPINETDWSEVARVGAASGFFALVGRVAAWALKDRLADVRRWSWRMLPFEAFAVLFCGYVGAGIAKGIGWTDEPAWMVPCVLAYFGPRFVEGLLLRIVQGKAREVSQALGTDQDQQQP